MCERVLCHAGAGLHRASVIREQCRSCIAPRTSGRVTNWRLAGGGGKWAAVTPLIEERATPLAFRLLRSMGMLLMALLRRGS